MKRFLKNAVMVAALGALVGASITVAAPGDRDGSGDSERNRGEGNRMFERRLDGPGPRGRFGGRLLTTAANKLGVSQERLRSALREVHQDLGPPKPPGNDSGDPRKQMEQRCTQVTDALGKELGKSGDDVRDAFKAAALEGLERAVDRGRISRERAARIRSRLEDRSCVLLPHAIGFRCGPGRGHGPGRGDGRGSVEPGALPAPPPAFGEQGAAPVPPPGGEESGAAAF